MTSTLRSHVPGRRGLAARVARLEHVTEELGENQQGKLLADNKILTAIGETQSKHSQQLNLIERKIDQLGQSQQSVQADMGMVKGRLEKVESKIDNLQADMGMVKGRLGKVEDKLTVIAKTQAEHTKAITGLESRMTGVETRLDGVETRLTRVEESLGTVNGKLDQIIDRLK
jgi:chromosome segregation ATPase